MKRKLKRTIKRGTALGLSFLTAVSSLPFYVYTSYASEVVEEEEEHAPQWDMYDGVYTKQMDYLEEYIDPEMYGQAEIPTLRNGWELSAEGKWNYYVNDAKQFGWVIADGKWYNLDDKGDMRVGWFQPDKDHYIWYYLNSTGAMEKGWIHLADGWYYLSEDVADFEGQMKTGWFNAPDGNIYYLGSNGRMQTGYVVSNKLICYLNEKHDGTFGALQQKDVGEWQPNGSSWTHVTNGAYDTGWFYSPYSKSWFYLDPTSKLMQTGWKLLNGQWYYLRPQKVTMSDGSNLAAGSMVVGIEEVDGKKYVFNTQPDMPIGAMCKSGWTVIDGRDVYVNEDGTMAYNTWVMKNGTKVYIGDDGQIKQSVVVADKPYPTITSPTGRPGGSSSGGSSGGSSIIGGSSTNTKYKQEVVTDRDGNKVYYDRYGNKVQSGWVTDKHGNNYFIENGKVVVNAVVTSKDGHKIFVDKDGKPVQSGLVTDKNGDSYFVKDGVIVTNQEVKDDKGNTLYVSEDGKVKKDEFYTGKDGNLHYVDKNGNKVENGVITDKNGDKYVIKDGIVSKDKVDVNEDGIVTDKDGNLTIYDKDGNKVENGFVTTPSGNIVYVKDGVIVKDQLVEQPSTGDSADKKYYYVGSDGKVVIGDAIIMLPNGQYIYVDKEGNVIQNGIGYDKDGNKYVIIDGQLGKDKWFTDYDGNKIHAGSDGKVDTSTIVPGDNAGEYFFVDENGFVVKTDGIYTDKDGNKVIVKNELVVIDKWTTIDGDEYHSNENGYVDRDKFITNSDGSTSYVDSEGKKVIDGIVTDSDGNKHVIKDGNMVTDQWVDLGDGDEPVYVDGNGNIVKNDVVTVVDPETGVVDKVYVDDNGHIIKGDGTVTLPDGNEIIIEDGTVVTDKIITDENGNDYYVDESGNKVKDEGIHTDKDGNTIITGSGGEIIKDQWVTLPDGSQVHPNETGKVDKDTWVEAPDGSGDKVHVDSDGKIETDTWVKDENGEDVYVGETGKPSTDTWVEAPDGSGDKVHVGENGKPSTDTWVTAPDGSGDKVHVDSNGKVETDTWVKDEDGDDVHVDADGKVETDKWITDENGNPVHVGSDGKVDKDTWVSDETGDKYVDENGIPKKDQWVTDKDGNPVHVGSDGNLDKDKWVEDEDGNRVKVDENGNITTDQIITDDNGNDVYVDENGHVKENGVIIDDDGKHIIENGVVIKDKWTTDENGDTVHVNGDGVVDTNKVVEDEDGNKKYVGEDGTIVKDQIIELPDGSIIIIDKDGNVIDKGLYEDGDGNHHFVKDDGTLSKNEVVTDDNGNKYHTNEDGVIDKDKWVDDHYYDKHGQLVTDSKLTDESGNTVWVDENGDIIKGTYVTNEDGTKSWVDENGHIVENGFVNDGNSYVEDGVVVTDRIIKDEETGNSHYFDEDGLLVKDQTVEVRGDHYPINKDGNIIPNEVVTNKDGTYVTTEDGSIYVGPAIVTVGDNDYYVGTDGTIMKDHFFEDENGKHYVDDNGHVVKNGLVIKEEGTYVFDENGNLVSDDLVTLPNGDTYFGNDAGLLVKGMAVVTDKNGVLHIVDETGKVVKATDYEGDGFTDYDFAKVEPFTYIIDKSGDVLTETVVTDLNQDKWFTSNTGKLVIGQFVQDSEGNKYLTGSDGRVVINKWIENEEGEHTYVGNSGIIGAPHNHEGDDNWTQLAEARCAVDGLRVTFCKECGSIVDKEIIPATGHDPEWRSMSAPSCTANGQQSNVCKKCGEIVGYQTINYLGHEWDEGEVVEPTCRAQGYTVYHCQREGCTLMTTDNYTPLVEHTHAGYAITTAPTCVSVGYEQDTCSECGTILDTRTVEAKGHIWDMGHTVNATCITEGYQEQTCITCGAKTQTGQVEALGHAMSDFDVVSEPSCTSAGFEQSVCDICGYTVYEKHDPLGHSVEEDYDYEFLPGYAVKRCETCESLMEREPNRYYVDYNPNSGVGEMEVDTFTYNKSKALKPNAFNRAFEVELDPTGGTVASLDVDITSEFTGWALEEGGGKVYSNEEMISTLTTVPDETVTLYASWRDVADLPKPTKVGYHFNAWKDANGNIVTGQIHCNNGESVTLYADWIPNNDTEYVVKHYKETLTNTWDLVATDELWGTTNTPASASTYNYTGFKTPTPKTTIIAPDGSTVIEYYYERETYTLYLDKGEGISVVNGAGDYKYGETVKVSAVVSDSTYKWGGWSGNFTPNNTQEASFKMPAYNVTLLANAKGNSYTVEYDNSDCKGRIEPSIFPFDEYKTLSDGSGFKKSFSVNFQSQSDLVYETQKIDLGFLGWSTTPNSSTVVYRGGEEVKNIAEYGTIVLYPVWEKRTINLPTPTKANHIFLGWSTNGQTSGLISAGSYTPTDDTTLVGLWRKAEYTVKFDGNGANSGSVANQKCTSGDNCRLNSNTFSKYYTITLDPNGGTCSSSTLNAALAFQGWSESPNSQVVYANNGNINKELSDGSEIRLYASWGSGSVNLPAATRTGYTFLGWSESPVAQTGTTGSLSGITSDRRLYAVWSANPVVISYNANGGTGNMNPSTFKYGIAQALTVNAFTKTYKVSLNANGGTCTSTEISGNADFLGWATSAGGIVVYTNSQYMSATSNMTLYAKWGRVTMNLPTPTKDGYTFAGWSESASATSGLFDSYTCEGNVTLYATWTKKADTGTTPGGDDTPSFDTSGLPNFTTASENTTYLLTGVELRKLFANLTANQYSSLISNSHTGLYALQSGNYNINLHYTPKFVRVVRAESSSVGAWQIDWDVIGYKGVGYYCDTSETKHQISCGIRVAGKCEANCVMQVYIVNSEYSQATHNNSVNICLAQDDSIRLKGSIFANKDAAFMYASCNMYSGTSSSFSNVIVNTNFVVDGSGLFAGTNVRSTKLKFPSMVYANYMFHADDALESGSELQNISMPKVEYATGMFDSCSNLASLQGLMYMPNVKYIDNINYGTNVTDFPSYVFGSLSGFKDATRMISPSFSNLKGTVATNANGLVYGPTYRYYYHDRTVDLTAYISQ